MQGLAELQEHVVGDVHQVVDGPQTARPRRWRIQKGDGPTGRPATSRAAYRGQGTGSRMVTLATWSMLSPASGKSTSGMAQGLAEKRRHFPGQTQNAQAVRPVGGHGHFQDHVGELQGLGQVPPQRQILGNIHQAGVVGGHPQFVFGQEHALGDDAPELGRLEFPAAGISSPRGAQRHRRGRR